MLGKNSLSQMNWSARGNVLNQYLSNTSIGTTVITILRDGPFDFSWGGGAFLRVLDFFLDLTDSARLFFIEYCACTIFF
jgi:hypothetical protein